MAKGFGSQLKTSARSYSQTVETPQFNSINAIQDNGSLVLVVETLVFREQGTGNS
jgi:hypothetical protein